MEFIIIFKNLIDDLDLISLLINFFKRIIKHK